MSLFTEKDYRKYVRGKIADNRHVRGYQTLLAKAAGCQRSYLSQVLNSHIELTPDHAAGLCRFWNFNDSETEYFLNLVYLSRAASPHLKRAIQKRLCELQRGYQNIAQRLKKKDILPLQYERLYYSSWHWSAIHIILGIPAFRTVEKISGVLGLPGNIVNNVLSNLSGMGLVRKTGNSWIPTNRDMHLSNKSNMMQWIHSSWRQKSMLHIQQSGNEDGINYSTIHSLSHKDSEKCKEILLECIEKIRALASQSSTDENLICFLCDFFSLTE